jgi:hypothetical protein
MAMILNLFPSPGLLQVVTTGDFSLEEAERTFLEVLDAVAQHKTEKILIDGRGIRGKPETIHRFLYGEFAARAVMRYTIERRIPSAPQFAYVLPEPILDPQRFGETVAVNRGMWVKTFDKVDDALEWLGLPPTVRHP